MDYRRLAMRLRWEITEEIGRRPGTRLPSISELADQHGTSRATASRALRVLAHEGLIDVVHGKGAYVIGPDGDLGMRTDRPKLRVIAYVLRIAEGLEKGARMPRMIELAEACDSSVQTVYRARDELIKRGVLRRVSRGRYVRA